MSNSLPDAQDAGSTGKTRVLIVDDSALIRRLLTDIVSRQPDMVVVGAAADPLAAREMIRATNPDVLTLDIEMPKMDGLEFLEKLMRLKPMPVVMVSSLTRERSEATLRALELGAIDFIAKPTLDIAEGIEGYAEEIVTKIRVAAGVPRRRMPSTAQASPLVLPRIADARLSREAIIVIGASTGGTEAIRHILRRLPPDAPAVLIAQHMPPGFTQAFAARLNTLCTIEVKEADAGERLRPGYAYVAPGSKHLRLGRSGSGYVALIDDDPPVNRHKPSVDVLFRSAAKSAGRNAIGVILTGMGKDGAEAMLELKAAGAHTIAQDEASCVVFGMPREAIALGAAIEVLPLPDIAPRLLTVLAFVTAQPAPA